jgi:hypothetical protein
VDAPANVAVSALPELRRLALLLLAELRQKPVRLTASGAPNKTDLRRVASAIGANRQDNQSGSSAIPALLYLTLATLVGARLLRVDGSTFAPVAETSRFFSEPTDRLAEVLLQAWAASRYDDLASVPTLSRPSGSDGPWLVDAQYAQPSDAQLSVARMAVVQAISRLVRGDPASWYRIDELAEFIREQYPDLLFSQVEDAGLFYDSDRIGRYGERPRRKAYPGIFRRRSLDDGLSKSDSWVLFLDRDWMEVEGAFIHQILAASLRYLGITEVGPGSLVPDRFRLTAVGQSVLLGIAPPAEAPAAQGRAAIVQPNFEVMVLDAAANFSLLAQLDAFAERLALDRAATYRLTQAAMVRGLDQGWSGDEIVAILESANNAPLPQNVRYSLDQWLSLYLSVTLYERVSMLEVDSAEQLDRMFADQRLEALLGERLGPTTALIPAQCLEEVLTAAREAGGLHLFDLESERIGSITVQEPDCIDLSDDADEPYLRYRLDELGEIFEDRGEHAGARYRITQDSIARATANGPTGSQLAVFLGQINEDDLPAEFFVRLLGWGKAVQPLSAELLTAVQIDDGGLDWDVLRGIPAFDALVRARLSPSVALISSDDTDSLRHELDLRGLRLEDKPLASSSLQPIIPDSALRAALERYWEGPQAIRQTLQSLGFVRSRTRRNRSS